MAKKEPPQEYIEVLEVLNVLYDEVDGCSFYNIFLLSLLFTATLFAMHRIYANRINSRDITSEQ